MISIPKELSTPPKSFKMADRVSDVNVIIVLLEYVPTQGRVIVRGAWREEKFKPLPLLIEGNVQNEVKVFENVDMKFHVGFSGI